MVDWVAIIISVVALVMSVRQQLASHRAAVRQTFLAMRLDRLLEVLVDAHAMRNEAESREQLHSEALTQRAVKAEHIQSRLHCLAIVDVDMVGLERLWRETNALDPVDSPTALRAERLGKYLESYGRFERDARSRCQGDSFLSRLRERLP